MAAQCIETTVTVCHSLSQCISRQRHEDANAFIITHNSMSDDITNVSSQIPITHTSMFLDHHRSFYFISITNKTLYNTKTPRKHKKKSQSNTSLESWANVDWNIACFCSDDPDESEYIPHRPCSKNDVFTSSAQLPSRASVTRGHRVGVTARGRGHAGRHR